MPKKKKRKKGYSFTELSQRPKTMLGNIFTASNKPAAKYTSANYTSVMCNYKDKKH